MINTDKLKISTEKTNVEPSNKIFKELGNNTYDYKDLLSELIDNSIAAKRSDRLLQVTIDLFVDDDSKPIKFLIRDNAKGISKSKLGPAITPAGITTDGSLNEHGLGMKQAVAGIGDLDYLATKTEGEDEARIVLEFKFGEIDTYFYPDFSLDSGTEICIKNIKPIVSTNPSTITQTLVPYLGARYRKFLKLDNPMVNIRINIKNVENDNTEYTWEVEEIKPIYFHPSKRKNKPVLYKEELEGEDWKALLTFGYAPDDDEYDELGLEKPKKYHPYNVSQSKQGLDIILHNRVILFHQLSELGIINSRHPDYNRIRGEIILTEGFSTAITKNSIIHDDNFMECINKVKKILTGDKKSGGNGGNNKSYLKSKKYPEIIPEALLRDRLSTWLENNPMDEKEDVKTERVVEGLAGFIDIIADGDAWEIKRDQANGLDVYQLFAYLDMGKIDNGYLVAKSFSTGAQMTVEYINKNHDKKIKTANLDDFPINHPPSSEERDEYYWS